MSLTRLVAVAIHLRLDDGETAKGRPAMPVLQERWFEEHFDGHTEEPLQSRDLVRGWVEAALAQIADSRHAAPECSRDLLAGQIVEGNELGELLSPVWECHRITTDSV